MHDRIGSKFSHCSELPYPTRSPLTRSLLRSGAFCFHDALIVAAGRELGAPVVSRDGALTHEKTKKVVDVEEY